MGFWSFLFRTICLFVYKHHCDPLFLCQLQSLECKYYIQSVILPKLCFYLSLFLHHCFCQSSTSHPVCFEYFIDSNAWPCSNTSDCYRTKMFAQCIVTTPDISIRELDCRAAWHPGSHWGCPRDFGQEWLRILINGVSALQGGQLYSYSMGFCRTKPWMSHSSSLFFSAEVWFRIPLLKMKVLFILT